MFFVTQRNAVASRHYVLCVQGGVWPAETRLRGRGRIAAWPPLGHFSIILFVRPLRSGNRMHRNTANM